MQQLVLKIRNLRKISELRAVTSHNGICCSTGNASCSSIQIFNASTIATALLLFIMQGVQSEWLRATRFMQWLYESFGDLTTALLVLPALLLLGVTVAWGLPRVIGRAISHPLPTLLALGCVLIASVIKTPLPRQPGLWAGFGFVPTLASLSFALLTFFIISSLNPMTIHKNFLIILKVVLPTIALIPYSLIYIQPPNGLINLGDTSYHVLDELLAPLMGAYPLGDYSPQYSGMLGWLIYPLRLFSLSGETTMLAVIITANVFNLLIPFLVFLIVKAIFPTLPKMITITAFVVIWGVAGSDRGASVHLREFANFGRFVPVLCVIWILVRMLKSSATSQLRLAFLVGFANAFIILGSADHGLSFTVALLTSMSWATYRKWFASKAYFLVILGIILGIVGYCLALVVSGQTPSLNSWVGLRSGAQSLYGGGVIDLFGPHLIIMSIAVSAIAHGLQGIRNSSVTTQEVLSRVISLSLGLWILALLVKFLLAPHPVGVPPLLIPSFIAFLMLIGHFRIDSPSWSPLVDRLQMLPMLFVAALPLAALWQFPNPQDELRRISGRYVNTINWSSTPGRVSDGWSPSALKIYDDVFHNTALLAKNFESKNFSVGYFGIFGHTVELLTGVDNVLGIPAPESLRFGSSQEKLACVPVDNRMPHFVIVYASPFPCLNYKLDLTSSTDKFLVYQRVGPILNTP